MYDLASRPQQAQVGGEIRVPKRVWGSPLPSVELSGGQDDKGLY